MPRFPTVAEKLPIGARFVTFDTFAVVREQETVVLLATNRYGSCPKLEAEAMGKYPESGSR